MILELINIALLLVETKENLIYHSDANYYGNKLRIYTRNSSEDLRAPDSASALPQNKWVCVCVTYTNGNTKNVYLDGKLDRTITGV